MPASAAERAGKLREKLNLLLANLKEEQRLESEHHWTIMRKILTPMQVRYTSSLPPPPPTHTRTPHPTPPRGHQKRTVQRSCSREEMSKASSAVLILHPYK